MYGVEIVPTRCKSQAEYLVMRVSKLFADRGQVNAIGNASFWLVAFIEVYASPIALDRATGTKIFIWSVILRSAQVFS